jgi:hypothetical protein
MEMRVKREYRSFRKYPSISIPGHRTALRTDSTLERIASYRRRSGTFKSRKSDKGIIAPYRLFKIFPE